MTSVSLYGDYRGADGDGAPFKITQGYNKDKRPDWDNKPTRRPTAYMITWKFKGVIVLCVGPQRHLVQPLSLVQKAFLRALQVPEHYFTHPPRAG
jgi:hypothetical protein